MPYDPLDGFVAPARARPELWRTLAGVVLAYVAGLALFQAVTAAAVTLLGAGTAQTLFDEITFYTDSPRGALLGLYSYAVFAAGIWLALRALHARPLSSLLGPAPGLALAQGLWVALAVGALLAALLVVLPQDTGYVRNTPMTMGLWLALLPLSLAAVAVQAGTEELLFRGYLLQQLAARFPRAPLWLVAPAALFALAHWSPEAAGPNALSFVIWAFAFGLAAADLTARAGTLGPAIGLHLAVNAFALLVAGLQGPGAALALWHLPIGAADPRLGPLFWPELMTLLCAWLTARLALRR